MPATWTVLAFISIHYKIPIIILAVIGATFAMLGRLTLAKLSQVMIREKILKPKTKENIDHLRKKLEERKKFTFAAILFYAFSPFPSNQLFIAYGLTKMNLGLIALPFFIGRLISYEFFTFTTNTLAARFFPFSAGKILSGYFIFGQLGTILVIYLFTKIDWKTLFTNKKISFIKHSK